MIATWVQGAFGPDPMSAASFIVPLDDLGAGVANLVPIRGDGPATFSRASVAWTKLATGLWAQVASGSPRSKYTGADTAVPSAYGGFWREAAGIQLVTPTASIRDMTDASWVKTTMTAAKTSTGIDGVANSCTRLTASAGNATAIQTLVAAATSRTYSAWIRRVTGTGNIELTQDGATFTNIAGSLNSTTYTLVQLNATQLNATFGIRIVTNGDAIDVDFNQFEAGAYATSPMATAGAARVADSLTYPGSNINTAAGTAYAEVQLPVGFPAATGASFIGTDVGASGRPLLKAAGQAVTTISAYDGITQPNKAGIPDLTSQVVKSASSWGAALAVTGNGLSVASGVFDGSMGDGSTVTISGYGAGSDITNGTIKNVRLWKYAVTDSQLSGITT